jgi:subtilase family serine protease
VAIVDAYLSPTLLQDAQTYAANNDPDYPLDPAQFTATMAPGTAGTPDTSWYIEQNLDVEALHAMAPGANIVYVGAQTNAFTDFAAALNYIIDNQLADIISNSYGTAESQPIDFVVVHSVATEAGLKGVGLYFSSGDNGDESVNLGYPSPDFPASMDNVMAVGGTSMAVGQTGTVLWQVGWETGASWLTPVATDGGATDPDAGVPQVWEPAAPGQFIAGAGGGASYIYEQPTWQAGIVPPAMANVPGAPARVVPDVSMLADPWTGFWMGQTDPTSMQYGEFDIGGTSLACPLFAATMALAEQNAGHGFGFANPLFYASQTTAFTDVVPNPVPQAIIFPSPGAVVVTYDAEVQSLVTAPGYDNITGLGVPAGQAFLDNIQ